MEETYNDDGALAHLPEVEHVEQDRDLHEVDPPADVVVPQHDQVPTQLQAGLLYEVRLPVTLEDLQQVGGVNVRGIF